MFELSPVATNVKALEDYEVLVTFETGEVKKYDMKPYISGSWFGELSDKDYFKKVSCNGDTIEWENGQDVCPDDLYLLSIAV